MCINISRRFATICIGCGIVLQLCCIYIVGANIVNPPVDTEAIKGANITLICGVDSEPSEIQWHHFQLGMNLKRTVYLDGIIYKSYQERFAVSFNRQQCLLTISNIQISDAGKFMCMHNNSEFAELIVFDYYPPESCVSNPSSGFIIGHNDCGLTPASASISCKMRYYGNKPARMLWKVNNMNTLRSEDKIEADNITTSTVYLNASATTTLVITCTIYYHDSNIKSKFIFMNITEIIAPLHNWLVLDTNCSSKVPYCGNKYSNWITCQPLWKLNGSRLPEFPQGMKNLPTGTYECSNDCTIDNKKCLIQQLTIQHKCSISSAARSAPADDTSMSTSKTIIAVVVVVVLAVIVVFIVVFIVRKYRKRRYAGQDIEGENGVLLSGSSPTPGAIFGIGVLDETIFIVKVKKPVGCILEMYDLKPVTFKSACSFSEIINPKDLAVCTIRKHIFICDWKLAGRMSEIFCVNKHGMIHMNWSLPFEKGRITVTHDGSIVVADACRNTIQEWNLHLEGITVITQFKVNKQHLMHAAKLADGNFVASFGDKQSGNQEIRIMDCEGNTLNSFKNTSESKSLSVPRSLAFDKTGNVYVCDLYRKRIVLMTPELSWKEELRTTIENEEVRGPLRACVYESENLCQLLVADCMKEANKWTDGKILVWDLSSGTAPIT